MNFLLGGMPIESRETSRQRWKLAFFASFALGVSLTAVAQAPSPGVQLASASRPVLTIPVPFGMQDVAYDTQRQQLFLHYVHKVNGQELAGVQRYDVSRPEVPRLLDSMAETDQLGHQGLSLEHMPHGVQLWGSAAENQGKYAIRFRYEPNRPPVDLELYKLFGDEFIDRNVTMPKVCSDEKHLIARGRKSSRGQIIRIFDLQRLRSSPDKDASSNFVTEWTIDSDIFRDGLPLQGIACDDAQRIIYLVLGKSNLAADKRMYVYNFEGRLLRKHENLAIGIQEGFMENGSYEPEGMTFFQSSNHPNPMLVLSFVTGRGMNKIMRLWPIEK